MPLIRPALLALLWAAMSFVPVHAQNAAAVGKSTTEFHRQSESLAESLASLSKRANTASPHDKEMLGLIVRQLSLVDATADGVLALGVVTSQMRDAADLASAKKQLAARCTALKTLGESTSQYVASLTSNVAAVALVAEVNKARDIVGQQMQSLLCNPESAPTEKAKGKSKG